MIKVFKVSDLIKYFIKIVIPANFILLIINALAKEKSFGAINKSNNNYIYCLDDEIKQISYKKENDKFDVLDIISETFLMANNLRNKENNENIELKTKNKETGKRENEVLSENNNTSKNNDESKSEQERDNNQTDNQGQNV